MNMKKLVAVLAAMFVVSTAAYALDLSVGVSGGAGIPFLRGDFADEMDKGMEESNKMDGISVKDSALSWNAQLDVLLTFMPFLALETGVGFSSSSKTYTTTYSDSSDKSETEMEFKFQRMQVYIPIMARGQYEYEVGGLGMLSYLSAGVKLGIPVADFYTMEYTKYIENGVDLLKDFTDDQKKVTMAEAAGFTMDISFAIGQEFKLADVHYVGLRIGYDLNVLDPYKVPADDKNYMEIEKGKLFVDSLNFNITYRYSFGSIL